LNHSVTLTTSAIRRSWMHVLIVMMSRSLYILIIQ